MGIFNIAMLHLKRMLKQKVAVILMLIVPLAVVLVVLSIIGGQKEDNEYTYKIAVVNNDIGVEGKTLIDSLKANNRYDIKELNLEDASQRVKTNMMDAAIVIPNTFTESINNGRAPIVNVLKLPGNNTSYGAVQDINSLISQRMLSKNIVSYAKAKGANLSSSGLEVQKSMEYQLKNPGMKSSFEAYRNSKESSIGNVMAIKFLIIFLMTSLTFVVGDIFDIKTNRTLTRSLSTPSKNSWIIGGLLAASFILFAAEAFMLISSTALIFNIYWGKSILALALICTLLIIVAISFGILASRWIKNSGQLSIIANLIVVPACLISGCMIPRELMPSIFNKIAYFIPQKWALDALNNIAFKDYGLLDILPQAAILLLFALAFFTAGSRSLRDMVK